MAACVIRASETARRTALLPLGAKVVRAAPVGSWALAVFICVFGVVITNCALFSLFLFPVASRLNACRVPSSLLDPRGRVPLIILKHSQRWDQPTRNAVVS